MHTIERQREQLQAAGITIFPPPDRTWLTSQGHTHGLRTPYALLMPGGAGLGPVKQWPSNRYAAAACHLLALGITPAIIGGPLEVPLAHTIRDACPEAVDLTGRTTIPDLAALGAGAALVLGNDTGPVHLAASAGAPTIVLFSAAGVPAQAAPRGPDGEWPTVLQAINLHELPAAAVTAAIDGVLR